jgi:hypothetical protein
LIRDRLSLVPLALEERSVRVEGKMRSHNSTTSSEKWVETPSFDRLRNTLQDGFTDCLVKCET